MATGPRHDHLDGRYADLIAIPGYNPGPVADGARSASAGIGVDMAVKRHTLDIYGTEIALATNKRDWRKLRKDFGYLAKKPNSAGLAHFAVFEPNDGSVVTSHLAIWIDAAAIGDDDLELVEIAAHEATHGVARIFGWIGHKIKGSDEPSAYLVGWLTRWIVEGVRGE